MKYDFYITGTIGEEFDWWTGQRGTTSDMVKAFLDQHKDQEVNIAVSSFGGLTHEGITMAEMIAEHGKCNMVIIGMTASAATILCMKAKSVKIAKGSIMLIHNNSMYISSNGLSNKQKIDSYIENLRKTREDLDTIDKAVADIYSHRNGKSIEENMAMMDKEKWMTAQEAVDFGIVDGILEDDETQNHTKAIQNLYASFNGLEEHFSLPQLPKFEKAEPKVPRGIMARLKEFISGFGGTVSDEDEQSVLNKSNPNPITSMNKTFLKVNALLKVEGLSEASEGVVLTVEQLQVIEDHLAELQGKVENLGNIESQLTQAQSDLETATTAQNDAEQRLANLQKEFDEFKAQAGADTARTPSSSSSANPVPTTAKAMYESIKSQL